MCYLNKKEDLQVTFHFEHDCLRLSSCTASPNSQETSTKQSFKSSGKEHISGCEEISTKAATNTHNSSVLPFRKRKIKSQFLANEIHHSPEVRNGRCETEMVSSNDDIIDDVMLPSTRFHQNAVAMPRDEYLLQQCGNLTINNGTRASAGSSALVDFNTNSSARAGTHSDAVSQLDDFSLAGSSSRLDHKSSLTQINSDNQSRFPARKDLSYPSTSDFGKGDQGPKILVEYLDDSDDETENFQPEADNLVQNSDIFINPTSAATSMEQGLDSADSLMQENGTIDVSSDSAMEDLVSPIDAISCRSNSVSAPECVLHEEDVVDSVNGVDSDKTDFENKLCISVALDDLEVINEYPISDGSILKNVCAIIETENSENLKKDTFQRQIREHSAKSKDNASMKRPSNKLVCLAEHSDIMYLNDIHLNRTCFKALELLSKNQDKTSRSLLYNTTRLCFLPLQAMTLTFDPVTIATGEEHHETIETVMATNNLRPEDVRLLDLSETEGDHGKYDIMMFDLVEPCGALRQQILEDIAVMRFVIALKTVSIGFLVKIYNFL